MTWHCLGRSFAKWILLVGKDKIPLNTWIVVCLLERCMLSFIRSTQRTVWSLSARPNGSSCTEFKSQDFLWSNLYTHISLLCDCELEDWVQKLSYACAFHMCWTLWTYKKNVEWETPKNLDFHDSHDKFGLLFYYFLHLQKTRKFIQIQLRFFTNFEFRRGSVLSFHDKLEFLIYSFPYHVKLGNAWDSHHKWNVLWEHSVHCVYTLTSHNKSCSYDWIFKIRMCLQ